MKNKTLFFKDLKSRFFKFMQLNPALELALGCIFSISIYIRVSYIYIPLLAWMLLAGVKRSLLLVTPLILGGLLCLHLYYGGPLPQKKSWEGTAEIHIQKVCYQAGFFGSSWVYSGVIRKFSDGEKSSKNLPFTLYRKGKQGPLDVSFDYLVEGSLKKKKPMDMPLKLLRVVFFLKLRKIAVLQDFDLSGKSALRNL